DRLTLIAQRISDGLSRALVVSPTDGVNLSSLPNTTTRANSVLGFDASGQPYAATLGPQGLIGWATWIVNNVAAAGTSAVNFCAAINAAYLPGDNDFTSGRVRVSTRNRADNGTDAASTAFVAQALGSTGLRGYLAGLTLSRNGGSPNTKID